MEITAARLALSTILRPVVPGIIRNIVEEAARSSGATPNDLRNVEAMMLAMTPPVLDLIASDDKTRESGFVMLAIKQSDGALPVPPVPPVVRYGLLEIGIRLGRAEVVAAASGRTDTTEILREFDILADQLRTATRAGLRNQHQQPR